jgi:hypothetical protein
MAATRIPHTIHRVFSPIIVMVLAAFLAYFVYVHRVDVPAEGDLGCFMAIAQQMRSGSWLYDGVWDNKAPGVFLIHAAAQMLTQSPDYPLFITIALLLLLGASAAYRFRRTHPLMVLLLGLPLAFWYLQLFVFWEVSYVGGFTEEWGLMLLLSAWLWFDAGAHRNTLMVSGLLFGAAILIKEPFALFYPAFLLSGSYRSLWLPPKRNIWHACVALPWLIFAGIYLITGRFHFLVEYLQGAFLYSGEGKSGLEPFFERFELLKQYWNPYLIENWTFFVWGLRIALLRFLWLVYRRYRFQEMHANGAWFAAWVPATFAAAVFLSLGAHSYLHYGIPLLALLALGAVLVVWDMGSWFSGPVWKPLRYPVLAGLIGIFMWHYVHMNRPNQELIKGAKWEQETLLSKLKRGANVYFDTENRGRFYLYSQSTYASRYPVPYYTYFYYPPNNHRSDVVAHRERFKQDFLRAKPTYIISESASDSAQVFRFTQLMPFINENYSLIDSFSFGSNYLYIRRKKM